MCQRLSLVSFLFVLSTFPTHLMAAPCQVFQQAEKGRKGLLALSFTGHARKDRKVLKRFIMTTRSLSTKYKKAAANCKGYEYAGLYRQAELYLLFCGAIENMPRPRHLSAATHKAYERHMKMFAARFEGVAEKQLKFMLRMVPKLKRYDKWVCLGERALWKLHKAKRVCLTKKGRKAHAPKCTLAGVCTQQKQVSLCTKREALLDKRCQ